MIPSTFGAASAPHGNDGLTAEIRNLHTARLIAAEDLRGLSAQAFEDSGMVSLAAAHHHDISRFCVADWHGVTE